MIGSRRRHSSNPDEGRPSPHIASSFTDLMASLMVIFILLFMATITNAVVKRNSARETTIEKLLGALKSALAAGGLDAGGIRQDERDPYAVIIVMPEDLLFKRGDSKVGVGGQQFLDKMIPLLSDIVCNSDLKDKIANVVVEGHTDTTWSIVGVAGADGPELNLELSQQRSMDVVRRSLGTLESGEGRNCFRRLLSASGRGQEELLPGVPGDDARQRRVVFKIRTERDALENLATELAPTVDADQSRTKER